MNNKSKLCSSDLAKKTLKCDVKFKKLMCEPNVIKITYKQTERYAVFASDIIYTHMV